MSKRTIQDQFSTQYGGVVEVDLDVHGREPTVRFTLDNGGVYDDSSYIDLHLDRTEARRLASHLEQMAVELDHDYEVMALTIHVLVGLGMLVPVTSEDDDSEFYVRPSAELEEVLRRNEVVW